MVADTYSSDGIGILLQGTGNDNNVWGSNLNANVFQVLVDAVTNALTESVTGGTLDLSTSPPPAASSQVHYAGIIVTGVLASDQIITVPNFNKWWLVKNATSGAFTVKFKTTAGSASTAIPQNSGWQLVQCDGANAIVVWPFNTVQTFMPDGSAASPPYSNVNEPRSGWYRNGTQDWRLSILGSDVLQITGAGAGTPSVVNVLSPNALQIAGVAVTASAVPAGAEQAYAGIELPSGGWLWEDGTAYSRATYAALFAAISKTATGNTHSNTTIDGVSADLRFKGLLGAYIEGTGIPTGTTITAITASTITLSQAASSTGSGVSLRIIPHGQGDASTTFNVPNRLERTLFGRGDMNATSDPGLITLAVAGSSPTSLNATFGAQIATLTQANLPNVNVTVDITDPGHLHQILGITAPVNTGATFATINQGSGFGAGSGFGPTQSATTGITAAVRINGNVTQTNVNKLPPAGITNWIIKT